MGFAGIVSFYRLRPQNAFPARSSGIFIHPLAPEFLGFTVPALPPAFLALPSFPSLFPVHSLSSRTLPEHSWGGFKPELPVPGTGMIPSSPSCFPEPFFWGSIPHFPQKHPGEEEKYRSCPAATPVEVCYSKGFFPGITAALESRWWIGEHRLRQRHPEGEERSPPPWKTLGSTWKREFGMLSRSRGMRSWILGHSRLSFAVWMRMGQGSSWPGGLIELSRGLGGWMG